MNRRGARLRGLIGILVSLLQAMMLSLLVVLLLASRAGLVWGQLLSLVAPRDLPGGLSAGVRRTSVTR